MSIQIRRPPARMASPNASILEYFRAHPIFGVLPNGALTEFLSVITERTYQKGHHVYYAGDPVNFVITVVSGLVALMRVKSSDTKQVVVTFGPGDVFGTSSSRLGVERTCTAVAVLRSTLFLIPQDTFHSLYHEFPEVAFRLIEELHKTLVRSQETILRFTITPVAARVASFLLNEVLDHRHKTSNQRAAFDLPSSRVDLALLLGTTRESITRVLNRLCRDGVITMRGRTVNILDIDALRQLAS